MYMYQEDMSGSSNTVPAAVDEVAYEDAKTPYATLFLIRHGETLLNAAKVLQGSGVDPPLSGVGREQARLVGERFANIHVDNVAASQLLRARETAQYISQHHPNATFQVIPGLAEIHWGVYDGVPVPPAVTELVEAWKNGNFDARMPGGESAAEVEARALPALGAYLDEQGGNNRQLVVVIHGRLLRILLSSMLDGVLDHMAEYSHHNTCVNEIRVYRRNINEDEVTDDMVLAPWAQEKQRRPSEARRALARYYFEAVRLNDTDHLAAMETTTQATSPASLPATLITS